MTDSPNGAGPLQHSLEGALGVRPDSSAMARALGLLYIGGPTVAVICLLLPHSPRTNETAIAIMAAIAYAMVPVLFTQYKRLPLGAISAVIVLANTLVTAVVWFNHEATSAYAFFYLWVTPYAVIFFSRQHAALHLLYPAVSYAVILSVLASHGDGAPGGSEAAYWVQAMAALAVTALLVASLSRALRENIRRVDEDRRRRAMEINDDVVQRLVVARVAHESGRRDEGDRAVAEALERTRAIITELLPDADPTPGELRRNRRALED